MRLSQVLQPDDEDGFEPEPLRGLKAAMSRDNPVTRIGAVKPNVSMLRAIAATC